MNTALAPRVVSLVASATEIVHAAYFNRPGSRLVESAETLAEILHRERSSYGHLGKTVVQHRRNAEPRELQ